METESRCLASLGITTSVILLDRCIKNMEGWKERRNDPELFEQPIESVPGFIHAMWKGSYRKIFPEVVEKSGKVSANDFAFLLATVNDNQIEESMAIMNSATVFKPDGLRSALSPLNCEFFQEV
jgi:hypothetical protein